jgi:O-antigen/teichoic acid export membrane protein
MPSTGSSPRVALAAQLLSNLWVGIVSILAVPIYVKYLGVEAYGLVGLFMTLQVSLNILDLGLSATITREMARLGGKKSGNHERADLVRTLEAVYYGIAVLILVGLLVAAGPLARGWVKPDELDRLTIERAFRHMAFAIAAAWPASLYMGALLGQERQLTMSTINAVFSTTKAFGIIALFKIWRPTVDAFFIWQTINAAAVVVVAGLLVWRAMPGEFSRAAFRGTRLRAVWKFAAGVTGIDATGLILSQIDKIMLSSLLPLRVFGLFTLVSTIAGNVQRLVAPVYTVYYPRLAAVHASGDAEALKATYHEGAQTLAALVTPVCVVLALFSRETLIVWTGDRGIADASYLIMTTLIAGRLVNAVMHLPAALQRASGWTTLALVSNVVSVVVVVPLVFVAVHVFGAIGAAFAWVLLNVGGLIGQVPLMHRRLMPGEMGPWLRTAVVGPTVVTILIALPFRLLLDPAANRWVLLGELSAVGAICLLGSTLATPGPRQWLRLRLARESAP